MLNSRNKGQVGERELCAILGEIVFNSGMPELSVDRLSRNLDQVREGGGDILGIPGLCIEVKRQETLTVNTWWRQVCIAADKQSLIPVLAWRQNNKPWRFAIPGYLLVPGAPGRIEMEQSTFTVWLKHWILAAGN